MRPENSKSRVREDVRVRPPPPALLETMIERFRVYFSDYLSADLPVPLFDEIGKGGINGYNWVYRKARVDKDIHK